MSLIEISDGRYYIATNDRIDLRTLHDLEYERDILTAYFFGHTHHLA
jgi:hypothetical protein